MNRPSAVGEIDGSDVAGRQPARDAVQLWVDIDAGVQGDAGVPSLDDFQRWVEAALLASRAGRLADGGDDDSAETLIEVSMRIVPENEMRALNRQYRQRDRPTNVLSFPSGLPRLPGSPDLLSLGDIVLCPAIISAEAVAQHKRVADHWAHLSVHGVLHLGGCDHEDDASAEAMESLEIRILSDLSIANPYLQPSAQQLSR